MKELFEGVLKFREEDFIQHQDLYESLGKAQDPHTLCITWVDSRGVPNLITNSMPGDLCVIRNIGNIIPPYYDITDDGESVKKDGYLSTTSAIEYALNILNVKNVIICGHSNCGACAAIC